MIVSKHQWLFSIFIISKMVLNGKYWSGPHLLLMPSNGFSQRASANQARRGGLSLQRATALIGCAGRPSPSIPNVNKICHGTSTPKWRNPNCSGDGVLIRRSVIDPACAPPPAVPSRRVPAVQADSAPSIWFDSTFYYGCYQVGVLPFMSRSYFHSKSSGVA